MLARLSCSLLMVCLVLCVPVADATSVAADANGATRGDEASRDNGATRGDEASRADDASRDSDASRAVDAGDGPAVQQSDFATHVLPFLQTYCMDCHAGDDAAGDRNFQALSGQITDENSLVEMQDILDQLNLAEMPPSDAIQPGDAERRTITAWLTERIARYHAQRTSSGGQTVMRRLNSREYHNTIRDLLQLNMTMFDPTSAFPRDQMVEHRDNDGRSLVMSGYLLQQYLTAAERIVEKVMLPLQKPSVQTWTFTDGFKQQPEIDQVHRDTSRFEHLILYDVIGADKHEGAYAAIHAFAKGVPHDGFYEVEFRAAAVNRLHPYDDDFLGRDRNQPLRLAILAGHADAGPLHKPQPVEPKLAQLDLQDGWQTYKVRIWLDAGFTPRFTFVNGLMDARNLWSSLHRRYPDLLPPLKTKGIVEVRRNAIKHGQLPQIHIDDICIRGPFYDAWPTAGQRALLGDDWSDVAAGEELSEQRLREHLQRFASAAFRRPATSDEVDRIFGIMVQRQAAGRTWLQAYGDAVKGVLCSPAVVYLEERPVTVPMTETAAAAETAAVADAVPVAETVLVAETETAAGAGARAEEASGAADDHHGTRLGAYAVASRLSYFLWGSLPDQDLLNAAAAGQLQTDQQLAAHVRRMLADPKADGFIEGFLDSWLTLRDLGSSPPDRSMFREYYQYDLRTAMQQETRLFTKHVLDQNLSISHFLDSDFTFVNQALARHYGIDLPVSGLPSANVPGSTASGTGQATAESGWSQLSGDEDFRMVSTGDRRRGGLLGQASVMTVSANGIDTSPVVRGVWLLENILGTPPSPPPPDVEPLDPDVRGATTIRDQLDKHRNVPACFDCHRRIDPLGFALENFDAIGAWRDKYKRGPRIDAAGELPNGKSFQNVMELKEILIQQQQQFALALSSKLLAYATGRTMTAADRPHLDRMVRELQAKDGGFADLVELTVLSVPFRSE